MVEVPPTLFSTLRLAFLAAGSLILKALKFLILPPPSRARRKRLDALTSFGNAETSSRLYAAEKIPFFFRLKLVSLEKIAFTIISTLMFWGASYLSVWVCFALPAILGVALGLTEVSWWHPLMGPITNSYSIRQVWG